MSGAERAYQAYGDSVEWKTFDGRAMPSWAQLPERIQQAWAAVAQVFGA